MAISHSGGRLSALPAELRHLVSCCCMSEADKKNYPLQSVGRVDFSQRLITRYFHQNLPPDTGPRESGSLMSVVSLNLTILHININGFFSHRSELEARLCLFPALPLFILFNETKLDQSCPVPCLSGYTL